MLSRTIGINVRIRRTQLGWTQEDLAQISDLCVRTISGIERGKANPTADVIESLAKALDVSAWWLVV